MRLLSGTRLAIRPGKQPGAIALQHMGEQHFGVEAGGVGRVRQGRAGRGQQFTDGGRREMGDGRWG
ncbi:MAG: hypothetical protein VR73_13555 [Gammaproteobacteria bacterium BRH_c0]|nr:MAG: hypothetical protein VR73_13555 [Gammaproteobacteria bacterium BRH_c0]